jgi:hypothetical protein
MEVVRTSETSVNFNMNMVRIPKYRLGLLYMNIYRSFLAFLKKEIEVYELLIVSVCLCNSINILIEY